MAVEAHHLHLLSHQLFMNRELAKVTESQALSILGNVQTEVVLPLSSAAGMFSSPISGAAPSESGLTVARSVGKKRQREHSLSFLGHDLTAHFQHQMLDLDCLLAYHTERMRAELTERRKRFSRQMMEAMEEGVRKRLKAKEEEFERVKKLNWSMEERIRSLCVENQIWRELAQTNEATANVLRTNLEQILAAQIRIKEEQELYDEVAAPADDAESCCCGGNDDRETLLPPEAGAAMMARACRCCGEREPTVLLLPCRHLCLCASCAPITNSCPICNCSKSGSVNVNLS